MQSDARSALENIPNYETLPERIYTFSYAFAYALNALSLKNEYNSYNLTEKFSSIDYKIEFAYENASIKDIRETLNNDGVCIIPHQSTENGGQIHTLFYAVTTMLDGKFLIREKSKRLANTAEISNLLNSGASPQLILVTK